MVLPDRPQITAWRTRIACWIPKAKNIHSEYVILTAFHCNNGYKNTPKYYVTRNFPIFFIAFN